jgi:SNF2 family DNA or RNA helicase
MRADLFSHLQPENVRVLLYHGKDRHNVLASLRPFDVVLTTYSLLSYEWRASRQAGSHPTGLHSVQWLRIVLDEGLCEVLEKTWGG